MLQSECFSAMLGHLFHGTSCDLFVRTLDRQQHRVPGERCSLFCRFWSPASITTDVLSRARMNAVCASSGSVAACCIHRRLIHMWLPGDRSSKMDEVLDPCDSLRDDPRFCLARGSEQHQARPDWCCLLLTRCCPCADALIKIELRL